MSSHSPLVTMISALAALTGSFAAGSTHADACDPLYQAGIKSIQTPHHVYSTTTPRGGKPQSGEAIYAGGVEYLQLRGKWMRSPVTNKDMLDAAQEKLKTHPDVCTAAGDQAIGGQAVSVYTARNKEMGTQQTVRIFKSSGLMQGGTLTLPDGTLVESRYEYANVQAPAGVK